jgi:hypothetical protein
MNRLVEAALYYASTGWPVFPLEPGAKRPLGRLAPHGLRNASTDVDVVTSWWLAEPEANIGLRTGVHFDVLDVDGPQALDALERSGPIGGANIEGPTVATPRGWHCYVAPTGRGNTVNLGGLLGIDWRGAGGYVVAPPSVKAERGSWDWVIGSSPMDLGADTPIVPAPAWVLALFDRPRDVPVADAPGRHAGRTGYGATALERELGRLVVALEGSRNHQLNRSAFSLGQLVASGDLDLDEVGNALLTTALRIGLGQAEAVPTIKSGLRAGITTPRSKKVA